MCGIVGYIGKQKAIPILIEGLNRLEYRGYDSAGLAILDKGKVKSLKSVGRVSELEKKIKDNFLGQVGIAHTRWATHGKPSQKNCHPHYDCQKDIYIVHNGIIENYDKLKKQLIKKGHQFKSDTDSEVIAHLIEEFNKKTSLKIAIVKAMRMLQGTYGVAVISKKEPHKIIVARNGSPLVIGVGKDEFIIASDVSAIVRYTDKVIYLNDGEIAEISEHDLEISNLKREIVNNPIKKLDWTIEKSQKSGFNHFMLKEIFEQPESIKNALRGRTEKFILEDFLPTLGGLEPVIKKLKKIKKIIIISCGTSYYAGLVGEYMLEEYAGIPTEVEYASEFRYRKPILDETTAVIAISQSGETADTLAAIREAKNKGALTLGIVNVVGSTIARETEAGTYTLSGPEIGVASTKAFTSQLSILALWTLVLGRQRAMSLVMSKRIAQELNKIPAKIEKMLKKSEEIKKIIKKYIKAQDFLYLGRKYNFPIALEGALKIKETAYIYAEGYPTGEMKHGPIALIDKNFPSLFIIPQDSVYEKNLSGMQEIKARGGKIIALTTEGDKKIVNLADDVIYMPKTLEMLTPLISVIPLQLFAYHFGVKKGLDVDKPRNLAKSVTVE
jgi:glucosamine--fructose-6-phosphate aminotransferase (isomerizing)